MNGHKVNVATKEEPESNGTDLKPTDEWDNAALAKLVQFDDSPEICSETILDESRVEAVNPAANAVPIAELFDNPIQGKTKSAFSSRPIPKFAAVGGMLLVVFGVAGVFLNGVMGIKLQKKPPTASAPVPQVTPSASIRPGTEIGNLKTQLAVGSQEKQIKDLEKSRSPKMQVAKTQPTAPQPVSSPTPPPRTTQKTADYPPPRTYSQPDRQPYTPPFSPRTVSYSAPFVRGQPVAVQMQPLTPKPADSKPPEQNQQPAIDPMQQWMAMNRLGSYGSSEVGKPVPTLSPMPSSGQAPMTSEELRG